MIPYGRQDIQQADIDAVVNVLTSDFLTQGPQVPAFEKKVAQKVGVNYAVAVNSATSALHIACLALGVEAGDVVWTTPISFVASANCALYCGATIDFVDIDPQTFNMSVSALEEKLEAAEKLLRLPKLVIVVHLCGQPADMHGIAKLAKKFGFRVIEDASHAIGGKYDGQYIGSCEFSDITIFSFHPVKIITTAEGGMLVTQSPDIFHALSLLRSHGITRDPQFMSKPSEGDWYYQQIELGYNYRMTDIQAALGVSQLERVDEYVTRRHVLAQFYDQALQDLPIYQQAKIERAYSAFHLYVICIDDKKTDIKRKWVYDQLRKNGVGVNVHYIPIHLQPYYTRLGFKEGDFPHAEHYYKTSLTLPLFPTLRHIEQQKIVADITHIFR